MDNYLTAIDFSLSKEITNLGKEFWQDFLEVDYEMVLATVSDKEKLASELERFNKPVLEHIARTIQDEDHVDLSKASLAKLISEHATPVARTFLLLDANLTKIKRDVIDLVLKLLQDNWTPFVDTEYWGETSIPSVVSFHLLRNHPNDLRLFRLMNTAESVSYREFLLHPDLDAHEQDFDEIKRRIAHGHDLSTINQDVVQSTVNRLFVGGEVRARCVGVSYREDDESVTAFVLKELKRSGIREIDQVYYGTETEIMVLEFRESGQIGRFRGTEQEELASELLTDLMQAPVRYLPAAQHTEKAKVVLFLGDLATNKVSLFRLKEIELFAAPLPSGVGLVIREGPSKEHVGLAVQYLRTLGLDLLEELSNIKKIKVAFKTSDTDREHIFDIYFTEQGRDMVLVTFGNWAAARTKRNEFMKNLQQRYGIYAIQTRRSS